MTTHDKLPVQGDSKTSSAPPKDNTEKEAERQKAETQEVAGRHKNDGAQGHKGRR